MSSVSSDTEGKTAADLPTVFYKDQTDIWSTVHEMWQTGESGRRIL